MMEIIAEVFKALGHFVNSPLGIVLLLVCAAIAALTVLGHFVEGGIAQVLGGIVRVFGNWQLALLAATSLVLSLASGWTTWDGMRNFTKEPVLSLMATFGIQGVMLICAWMIGETFARGATGETNRDAVAAHGQAGSKVKKALSDLREGAGGAAERSVVPLFVLFAAVALFTFAAVSAYVLKLDDVSDLPKIYGSNAVWVTVSLGTVLLIAFVLLAFSDAEILGPYARGLRVILANLHLWVMFLACMSISVFFSFDSLFSTIFPADERARAADLRAQNQVAGLVAELGSFVKKRRLEESEKLFLTQGWKDYEGQLNKLVVAAQGSDRAIEEYFVKQMEEKRSGIAQQQERISTAQSRQASLAGKKIQLTEELQGLDAERPGLASVVGEEKSKLSIKQTELDAAKVSSLSEEKGVDGTGKFGKGTVWRQRKEDETKAQYAYQVQFERLQAVEKRLTATQRRIDTIKSELAQIDGTLANLKGEAQTAEQRIKASQEQGSQDSAPRFDPANVLTQLERARTDFRAQPDSERLLTIQGLCSGMLSALASTPATLDRARGIDCDPKSASEAAARVFALNTGLVNYGQNCAGGDKLPVASTTDKYLEFGAGCVQDSGLPGQDTGALRNKLNSIALNRDDKAHRFVVTWNAFLDGNRLAYLALGIAVALDGLVFMSGLFGANAIASPLANTPEARNRSVGDLQKVVESSLRPEKQYAADLTINLMQPFHSPREPKYTVMVDLNPMTDENQLFTVRKVLTAGSGLGLVKPYFANAYIVRKELHEYLLQVSENEHRRNEGKPQLTAIPSLDASRMPQIGSHGHVKPDWPPGQFTGQHGSRARDVTPQQGQLPANEALPRIAAQPFAPDVAAQPDAYGDPDFNRPMGERPFAAGGGQAPAANQRGQRPETPRETNLDNAAYQNALLSAVGLSLQDYARFRNAPLRDAAISAGEELDKLSQTDRIFAEFVDTAERQKNDALEETMKSIISNDGSGLARDVHGFANEMQGLRRVSMLTRVGDYPRFLETIIAEMGPTVGDHPLRQHQDAWYGAVKLHADELSRTNRETVQGWRQVGALIHALRGELAQLSTTVAEMPQGARLN